MQSSFCRRTFGDISRLKSNTPTQRATALSELEGLQSRGSQHNPGQEIPEDHWAYRFAKKHWFFGFGAYS